MSHATKYFKALSDDTRLRLVHVLTRYELSVNELVNLLEMGQSRISRHLKVLAEAGLLTSRRDGLWVFYAAVTKGEAHAFLRAVTPFLAADMNMCADMDMAARLIEDRALKTRQFFNAVADHWDSLNREVLGGFDLPKAVAEHGAACLPARSAVVVDLGCGTGLVLECLRERLGILPYELQLIGVDGSPRMLELARRRLGEAVSLRIGELDHLPLKDDEADFASLSLVLHHLSEPATALAEIRRVLRPGGHLLISDFDRHTQERMRTDYGDRWLGFDAAALTTLTEQAGFAVRLCERQPLEQNLGLHMLLAQRL